VSLLTKVTDVWFRLIILDLMTERTNMVGSALCLLVLTRLLPTTVSFSLHDTPAFLLDTSIMISHAQQQHAQRQEQEEKEEHPHPICKTHSRV
jgi:hypothetical protein